MNDLGIYLLNNRESVEEMLEDFEDLDIDIDYDMSEQEIEQSEISYLDNYLAI